MGSTLQTISLVSFILILGFTIVEINHHGSFKGSKTHNFLRDSGALKILETSFTNFRTYCQKSYRWCKNECPLFIAKCRENTLPLLSKIWYMISTFLKQMWANFKLLSQYFVDKKPAVAQWIDKQFPGLLDNLSAWFIRAWTFVKDYVLQLAAILMKYLSWCMQWLRENIFIGKLSPENLQKYTLEAINTTQTFAQDTFSWIHSRVVTTENSFGSGVKVN